MLARVISLCRYLLVVPVVCCLIMTAGVVIVGLVEIIEGLNLIFVQGNYTAKGVALNVIEIIDLFLIGTVSYIAALGIYKLFVTNEDVQILKSIRIESLGDLENKILGVVIAALAVAFLGQAASGDDPAILLNYGAGIALVIAALSWFMKGSDKR